MKRVLSVMFAVTVVVGGMAWPAQASDGANANGTQPVIALDNTTTCAIRENDTVYCWGSNTSGQLGRTGTDPSLEVWAIGQGVGTPAQSISLQDSTVCVVLITREVSCWGSNLYARLGNGLSSGLQSAPAKVSGMTRVATISVGNRATCASKQDGSVWCWGDPQFTPFTGFAAGVQVTPVKVNGVSNVVDVAVGANHACALRIDKHVVCWGKNDRGQLGAGDYGSHASAVVVPGIADATAVSVGATNSCAMRAGGTISCWGSNTYYALGVRSTAASFNKPTTVYGISGATSMSMSDYGGCAVVAKRTRCWGINDIGRLGDGQVYQSWTSVTAVASKGNVTSAATTYWGTCEIASGGVWCWGSGAGGRLGNRSTLGAENGTATGPGISFGVAAPTTKVALTTSAPGKPTGSSTAAKKIKISWTAPSTSNGASAPSDYLIQYRLKGATAWTTFKDTVSTARSVTVTGLKPGKYYQFRVYPKNWAGTGSVSAASAYIKSK